MNIRERFTEEVNKFENAAQNSVNSNAQRWLNVAYKLDYISLACKEKIDRLLIKTEDSDVSEQDLEDIMVIASIASSTRFSENQLKSIQ